MKLFERLQSWLLGVQSLLPGSPIAPAAAPSYAIPYDKFRTVKIFLPVAAILLMWLLLPAPTPVPTPFTGTFESIADEQYYVQSSSSYTIYDGFISYGQVKALSLTGTYWQGLCEAKDSLLEVLVFRTMRQSHNTGFASRDTRQYRKVIRIGTDSFGYSFTDTTLLKLKSIEKRGALFGTIDARPLHYRMTTDTVQQARYPISDCNGYCGSGSGFMAAQGDAKARMKAENEVLRRLSKELNTSLSPLPLFKPSSNCRGPHLTALIPTKNGTPVVKREVIIVDNSTPLNTEKVRAVLQEFYLKNSLENFWLQSYLLVELTIADGKICLVPA